MIDINLKDLFSSQHFTSIVLALAIGSFFFWKKFPNYEWAFYVFLIAISFVAIRWITLAYKCIETKHKKKQYELNITRKTIEQQNRVNARFQAQIDRIFCTLTNDQKDVLATVVLLGKRDTSENNVFIYQRDSNFLRNSQLVLNAQNLVSYRDGMDFTRTFIQQEHQNHFDLVRIDPYLLQLIETDIKERNLTQKYEQQDE